MGHLRQEGFHPLITFRLLWVVCGLLMVRTTVSGSGCELRKCWDLYQGSQRYLGITDDFFYPSDELPPQEQLESYCIVRRTFYRCLNNQTKSCRSDLTFHSLHRGSEEKLKRLHCSIQGDTVSLEDIPDNISPDNQGGTQPQCGLVTSKGHAYCALYGDPHLRTFEGNFQTCRLEGAWPLLDNEYLAIQVTNQPVSTRLKASTAITEVTVVIKEFKNCAGRDYVIYQAYDGTLPTVFRDGRQTIGHFDGVYVKDISSNAHVNIMLEHIDTVVSIRLVGQFYSVAVKMPQELLNKTVGSEDSGYSDLDEAPLQLCQKGCPVREQIDPPETMRQHIHLNTLLQQHRTKRLIAQSDRKQSYTASFSQSQALKQCLAAGLFDYYLDSCVFDLVITGDTNFTQQSQLAMLDMLNMVTETRRSISNRTTLPLSWQHVDDGAPPGDTDGNTVASSSCLLRTNFAVFIVLCVTRFVLTKLFHLDYVHGTTFILHDVQ